MNDVFLVQEPFNHSYHIVEAAARKGLDVFVIHTLPLATQPPFAEAASKIKTAIKIDDWFDYETVLAKLDEALNGAKLVGTYCGPELTALCDAHIRTRYGLPGNSPDKVTDLIDKFWVRSKLYNAGLSALQCFDDAQIAAMDDLPPPQDFFFKPRNGGGSAYVKHVRTMDDLRKGIAEWNSDDNNNPSILQSFIKSGVGYFLEGAATGQLMSAEGFTDRGEYHFFGLCGRMLIKADPTIEVGSTFPVRHPRLDEIKALTRAIHQELGYYHGPSHVEFMIPESGPIEMVEFNPRLAGVTNLSLFNLVMGQPTEDALVELGSGKPMPRLDSYSTNRAGVMCNVFSPVFGGSLETLETPDAEFLRVFKAMGDPLATKVSEFDYFACVMETGATMSEAVEKVEAARRAIVVNGVSVGDNDINDVITNGIFEDVPVT
jgi:biotin carboxylase